jgi:hypothetical protein
MIATNSSALPSASSADGYGTGSKTGCGTNALIRRASHVPRSEMKFHFRVSTLKDMAKRYGMMMMRSMASCCYRYRGGATRMLKRSASSNSSSQTKSSGPHIQKLVEFLQFYARMEGLSPPGYATCALGLSYEHIAQNLDNVSYDESNQTLKVRFPLSAMPKQALASAVHATSPGLSTYLAMMDDVTTWALVLADVKRGRAGKSVTFHAAWNPEYETLSPNHRIHSNDDSMIELSAQVKKIGQNIGFVAAHVRNVTDAARNDVVCYGSQIKYMSMGTVADFALSSLGWEWTKLYSNHILNRKDTVTSKPASDIYHSFQVIHGDDPDPAVVAKFTPSKEHISLGGPIHGGCQAVLMEMAANAYVKSDALTAAGESKESLRLDSMQVDYMSPPKSKTVYLKVFPVVNAPSSSLRPNRQSLCVQLLSSDQRKVQSEGLLHFVVAS